MKKQHPLGGKSNRSMSDIKGQIVAMGGGVFSVEPDNSLLDDFILSLAPQISARVCFIPTASADSAQHLVKFYRAFNGRAIATDLTIMAQRFTFAARIWWRQWLHERRRLPTGSGWSMVELRKPSWQLVF